MSHPIKMALFIAATYLLPLTATAQSNAASDASANLGGGPLANENMHAEAQAFQLDAIAHSLLSKLRPGRSPNVTMLRRRAQQLPDYLFVDELSEDGNAGSYDDQESDSATLKRVLVFAEKAPDNISARSLPGAMYFRLPPLDSNIKRAMLGVYVRPSSDAAASTQLTLRVYDAARSAPYARPLVTRSTSVGRGGKWMYVDVTTLARVWVDDTETNFGVLATTVATTGAAATTRASNGGPRVNATADVGTSVGSSSGGGREDTNAYLEIWLADAPQGRLRRSTPVDCATSTANPSCCRYPFTVDFDTMGEAFNFIVFPRSFTAYYCSGVCQSNFQSRTLAESLWLRSNPSTPRTPCCAPKAMGGRNLIYADEHVFRQVRMPEMTIRSCGCK